MEKKAMKVGKFNVVDIIAVVLILLVAALAAWKLLGPEEEAPVEGSWRVLTPGSVNKCGLSPYFLLS